MSREWSLVAAGTQALPLVSAGVAAFAADHLGGLAPVVEDAIAHEARLIARLKDARRHEIPRAAFYARKAAVRNEAPRESRQPALREPT